MSHCSESPIPNPFPPTTPPNDSVDLPLLRKGEMAFAGTIIRQKGEGALLPLRIC